MNKIDYIELKKSVLFSLKFTFVLSLYVILPILITVVPFYLATHGMALLLPLYLFVLLVSPGIYIDREKIFRSDS